MTLQEEWQAALDAQHVAWQLMERARAVWEKARTETLMVEDRLRDAREPPSIS